jgi:hypothetical protein
VRDTFFQNGRSQTAKDSAGGGRKRRKPRKRWLDDVKDNLRNMGVKRWRIKARDRAEFRKICEATKVLQEVYSHRVEK